ncbi:hypothetical protein [Lolliginicoccus suaedae]|uniref:hypothetical protein n=1 Tax=Lolliginicoccus suaedae TaxID=2605429 RepID=UPI0011F05677|nr:hypothetical protein [Lolliginicoccus suaedae]
MTTSKPGNPGLRSPFMQGAAEGHPHYPAPGRSDPQPPLPPRYAAQPYPAPYPAWAAGPAPSAQGTPPRGSSSRNWMGIVAITLGVLGILLFVASFVAGPPIILLRASSVALIILLGTSSAILGALGAASARRGTATNKPVALVGAGAGVIATVLGMVGTILLGLSIWGLATSTRAEAQPEGSAPEPADGPGASAQFQDASDPVGSLPAGASPAGSSVTLDGVWLIAMETRLDATGIVLEENPFNNAPPAGSQFVMTQILATNLTEEARELGWRVDFAIITANGSRYGMAHGSACGVIPEPMYAVEELAGGGAVISNVCAAVPSSQLSGAQWQITVYGDDYSTTTGFLALT